LLYHWLFLKNYYSIPWSLRNSFCSCKLSHIWSCSQFNWEWSSFRQPQTSSWCLLEPKILSWVLKILLIFVKVIEEVKQLFIDSFRLTSTGKCLLELLLWEWGLYGWEGFSLSEHCWEYLLDFFRRDFSIFR
jgi:hypothetical protein